MQAYDVKTKINSTGEPVALGFPYNETSLKVRELAEKKFFSVGEMSKAALFGADKFSAGQARAITITEGELDALSAFQMLGSRYPVVSVRGASSARKDCTLMRDYLNAFEKIYICFDNDEPGRKAAAEVAQLFDPLKVFDVKLTKFKDANEYLTNGDNDEFKTVWFNSKRAGQRGILSTFAEFKELLAKAKEKPFIPYPFPTLQSMTYGCRQGEVTLVTALEGTGKTEIIRAIEHHVLKTTDLNVGIIHLEESGDRALKGLAGYELQLPCHLPDSGVSDEEINNALTALLRREGRLHWCMPPETDDPDEVLDKVRYMVTALDCKYVSLDLITTLVTGRRADDQTQILDYLSTKFERQAEELGYGMLLVSHVNADGDTRGSKNISKTCSTWIHLDRNVRAGENKVYLNLNKNRFAAKTGPAGHLVFDPSTFMMSEGPVVGELPH